MDSCEALVIGAGPAGLTAAIYLARFRRSVVLLDAGRSRARLIPVSHNCPGFPHGVSGPDFLKQLRKQAAPYGIEPRTSVVQRLTRDDGAFVAHAGTTSVRAHRVILATGTVDVLPDLADAEQAVCDGVVRLCAICDAYETQGKRVAVLGPADAAARHAQYLRTFCSDVTALDSGDVTRLWREDNAVRVQTRFATLAFDVLYPALGAKPGSQLAAALGARCDAEGYLAVDAHLRTSVPGLFAIGDVAQPLNQIAVGVGHAAIAATAIHNELPARLL